MFYKFALKQFMDNIETGSDFEFLKFQPVNRYYFFEPSFQFEDKLYKRLADMDYENREDSFICAMYNRSPLNAIPIQARQFRAVGLKPDIGSDTYQVKNAKCQTNVCFVSNDYEYLTTFEEYFLVNYDRTKSYDTTYKIPTDYELLGNTVGVDTLNKKFTLSGTSPLLVAGDKLFVTNSTANDEEYTVVSVNSIMGGYEITVAETIPSGIPDGKIFKYKGMQELPVKIFLSDIEINQIDKLDTQSRGSLVFLVVSFNIEYPIILSKGGASIIKQIILKTKAVSTLQGAVMSEPFNETIIE